MPRQPRPLDSNADAPLSDELGQIGEGTLIQQGDQWRRIPPGGRAHFEHSLGVVPGTVDVSMAATGDGSNEVDAAGITTVSKSSSGVDVTSNHANAHLFFRVRVR